MSRRTTSLIAALAAGSLSVGLLAAIPAFADAPAGESPAQGGATFASLLADAPSASDAPVEAVPAGGLTAASDGYVAIDVPAEWESLSVSDDGVEYHTFMGELSHTQLATVPNDYKANEPDASEEFMDALEGEVDLDDAAFGTPQDRTVDGVPVRDVPFTMVEDGREFGGLATIVFGDGWTSLLASLYPAGEDAAAAQVEAVHASLALSGGAPATDLSLQAADAGAQTGSTGGLNVSFVIDDVRYTFSTDPATYGDEGGQMSIPLTIANADDEPQRSEQIEVTVTGPSGATEVLRVDSGDLEVGESTEGALLVTDDGTGAYVFSVDEVDDDRDDDPVRFSIEL